MDWIWDDGERKMSPKFSPLRPKGLGTIGLTTIRGVMIGKKKSCIEIDSHISILTNLNTEVNEKSRFVIRQSVNSGFVICDCEMHSRIADW